MDIIIDATNCIAGRLATRVAKEVLNGNRVHVVNVEKAVMSGNPVYTIQHFREKVQRGDPYHGAFYPRPPDRVFRRIVRGMLPHHRPRGKAALHRLHVHISTPPELVNKPMKRYAEAENRLEHKYVTLGLLSERLGAKKRW